VPGQYQVIPAYYHDNGIVMGNVRGLSNATPLRLVSPAPVLVNQGSAGENNGTSYFCIVIIFISMLATTLHTWYHVALVQVLESL
jgi:hypothetical protein